MTVALATTPQILNFSRLLPVAALAFTTAALWVYRDARRLNKVVVPAPLALILVWCWLSLAWSTNRSLTSVQTLSTTLLIGAGVLIASGASMKVLIQGVAGGICGCLVVCVALAIVVPSYGLMPVGYKQGALRGLYVHSNILGEVLIPGLVATLFIESRRHRLLQIAGIVGLMVGVFLSQSSTAIAAAASALILYIVLLPSRQASQRRRRPALFAAAIVTVLAVVWAAQNVSLLLTLLQRDATLTGRTRIWAAINTLVEQSPVGGYGWGAPWDGDGRINRYISDYTGFRVPGAHSGYLDLVLQIGFFGAGLVLILAMSIVLCSLSAFIRSGKFSDLMPLVLIAATCLSNLDETSVTSPLLLYVLALAASVGSAERAIVVATRRRGGTPSGVV